MPKGMQFFQKIHLLKKLKRQNKDDMSRDLSSSSIPLLCVRFHRKHINTSPRKHFQLITIATSFCFRPTRAKYYFWWPTIKSYDCVRPEILVSIAFCQLHICIWSYQGVDNALVISRAQVTIRERTRPHQGQDPATFQHRHPASITWYSSSPIKYRAEWLTIATFKYLGRDKQNKHQSAEWQARRDQAEITFLQRHKVQARLTSAKLLGAYKILIPVASNPRQNDLGLTKPLRIFQN